MSDVNLAEALARSTQEVLEGMCFSEPVPLPGNPGIEDEVLVSVGFRGTRSGSLRLTLERKAAISLAASFLGTTEGQVTQEQVEGTICELAKVICGHLLSAFDPAGTLIIDAPGLNPPERLGADAVQRFFQLDGGPLGISVEFG